jgi:Zn-dependent protease
MPQTEVDLVNPTQLSGAPCASCGVVLAPALLACPQCRTLVHRAELEELARSAEQASARGDIAESLSTWRSALLLLPAESKQYARITGTIRGLRQKLDDGAPPTASAAAPAAKGSEHLAERPRGVRRWGAAVVSALTFAALKLKALWLVLLTGWKPLLLGLTKIGTLWTMLLSLGVYWALYGWRFGLGLVVCIYVHEIGHVVALKRLGIAASSPMFIPGFGAVVRLQQYPIDADEEAQVGLAGPRWGLGISLVAFVLARLTHSDSLAAIARVSGWINLFNLIPIPPLDGGRGFRALGNQQRLLCGAVLGGLYALTHQGFVGIIALLAFARSFEKRPANTTQNARVLIEYLGLAILLCLIARGA